MLRIGLCAPYDLGRDGGVNSHIRSQARALACLGHQVCVFGASSAPLGANEHAVSACMSPTIGGTETGIGIDPRAWSRVGRLMARERLDVLHVHEPLMPIVPWCAVWRARVPVVATFHTHRERGHRFYPRYRALLAPLMARIDRRLAVSDAARRTVERHFPGAYRVLPNGIDIGRFAAAAERPHDMAHDRRHVLFVGRLEPRKGVAHLIDAMTIVQRELPDARLTIAGDGPDRQALSARARDAGLDAQFLGRVPDDRLPAYYACADLVCSPATGDESFGIVLVEAMAAGRPIVATCIEGYAELIAGDTAGVVFVPPGDARALAGELLALLRDTPRRKRLGAAGRLFAARFDWNAIARELETIYLTVLEQRRAQAAGDARAAAS